MAIPSGLPTTVTIRSRPSRSISVGPRIFDQLGQTGQFNQPDGRRWKCRSGTDLELVVAISGIGAEPDVVLLVPSRNLETGMPPTRTRSVSAIVPTGTPRSLAASRSTTTCTSGLRSDSVVSRSTNPGSFFNPAMSWSA